MFRRGISNLNKLVLVESPTKVGSYTKYIKAIQQKGNNSSLDFGRKDLRSIGGVVEKVIVKPTIGHMHTCSGDDVHFPKSANNSSGKRGKQSSVVAAESSALALSDRIFENKWQVDPSKRKALKEIKDALAVLQGGKKKTDETLEVIIATDPDREGELIGRNVLATLLRGNPKIRFSRMYVHAITEEGIAEGLERRQLGFIDKNLVAAADTRSAMDQIFGFVGSTFVRHWQSTLWSIGRVQTPSLILLSRREKEIRDAVELGKVSYFGEYSLCFLDSKIKRAIIQFEKSDENEDRDVVSKKKVGKKQSASQFSDLFATKKEALAAFARLTPRANMTNVTGGFELLPDYCSAKDATRAPPQPLTMQTLILEADRKLGMSSEQVARSAQNLFHAGVITYPRTDSVRIEEGTVKGKIMPYIATKYGMDKFNGGGEGSVGGNSKKSKRGGVKSSKAAGSKKKAVAGQEKPQEGNIEDAHEAIHPTQFKLTPGSDGLNSKVKEAIDRSLYDIIFNTTVAAFMIPSELSTVKLAFSVPTTTSKTGVSKGLVVIKVGASKRTELGWKAALNDTAAEVEAQEKVGENEFHQDDEDDELFDVFNQIYKAGDVNSGSHQSDDLFSVRKEPELKEREPRIPRDYTEGTLIQELKRNGIGRPSTYPSIIKTLKAREYVGSGGGKLKLKQSGEDVVALAEACFPTFVDLKFTQKFETNLDAIAKGDDVEATDSQEPTTLKQPLKKTTPTATASALQQKVLNDFYRDLGSAITSSVQQGDHYLTFSKEQEKEEVEWIKYVRNADNLNSACWFTKKYLAEYIPPNCGVEIVKKKKAGGIVI